MSKGIIKQFYARKEWIELRLDLIIERNMTCERCGKHCIDISQLIGHHKIPLTEANINDVNITLNPENIEIICFDCHNEEHERFGYKHKQEVYIVYGPPCSGKTSYVLSNMVRRDLVIDMDRLYEAVSLLPRYDKPDVLRYNVFAIRNLLIEEIKTRYGKWHDAYIIGGYANKTERERLAKELGAELIYCEATKLECIGRLNTCNDYRMEHKEEWIKYIDKWFAEYTP